MWLHSYSSSTVSFLFPPPFPLLSYSLHASLFHTPFSYSLPSLTLLPHCSPSPPPLSHPPPFPFSHTLLCLTTLFLSLLNGEQVTGADYAKCLRELVNICVLCNDSELTYNEVRNTQQYFPDLCLSYMYLDSMHCSVRVHSPLIETRC